MTASEPSVDVRLEGVVKKFDDVVAVDGISLDVPRGSFFALLGPSGCGKTTTLRMIGGFEEPTEGRILLGDRDVVGLPPYKRDVNTVFQSYALFPHLTIFENVAFGLRRRGLKGSQLGGRVLHQSFDVRHPQTGNPVSMKNIVVEWHPDRLDSPHPRQLPPHAGPARDTGPDR